MNKTDLYKLCKLTHTMGFWSVVYSCIPTYYSSWISGKYFELCPGEEKEIHEDCVSTKKKILTVFNFILAVHKIVYVDNKL